MTTSKRLPPFLLTLALSLVGSADAADPPKAPADVAAPPAEAEVTASGLASRILARGTGDRHPGPHDRVTVHYTGWTTDGRMFDSSVVRGRPSTFGLDQVIPGWSEGVQLMVEGEKRRLWIPEALAYGGRQGAPAGMLVFDIELVSFEEAAAPPPVPEDVAGAPPDAEVTSSGLASRVLSPGSGSERPGATDRVTVHYTGWTTDGTMFDSSVVRGQPATFGLDQVIPGWSEGVQLMVAGEKRRFWIPEKLAYAGREGAPQGTLVFDVELVSFATAPPPPPVPEDVAGPPPNAEVTSSGLASRVLSPGSGSEHPKRTSRVTVHYTGWTTDGTMFDSSVVRGQPATFGLRQVIPGWSEGVQLMVTGEKRRLWIPEKLAYAGREGAPQGMLVFDIELIAID